MNAVYEYIDMNGTTTILNVDIESQVRDLIGAIGNLEKTHSRFSSGNSLDSQYENLLTGNLCVYSDPTQLQFCEEDPNSKKGLMGIVAYYNKILTQAINSFKQSNRTTEAMIEVLQNNELVDIEANFYYYVRPAFHKLGDLVREELTKMTSRYSKVSKILATISIVLHIILPLIIWKPMDRRITKRYDEMKWILKPAPMEFVAKMRRTLGYLIKISPQSLGDCKPESFN